MSLQPDGLGLIGVFLGCHSVIRGVHWGVIGVCSVTCVVYNLTIELLIVSEDGTQNMHMKRAIGIFAQKDG